jgi:hypothetical protein
MRSERDSGVTPTDGVADLAARVTAVFEELQPPTDPMLDFDERDLLRARPSRLGSSPSSSTTRRRCARATLPPSWDAIVSTSGNPLIPTIGDAIDQALAPEERERFVAHLRRWSSKVAGPGVWRRRTSSP